MSGSSDTKAAPLPRSTLPTHRDHDEENTRPTRPQRNEDLNMMNYIPDVRPTAGHNGSPDPRAYFTETCRSRPFIYGCFYFYFYASPMGHPTMNFHEFHEKTGNHANNRQSTLPLSAIASTIYYAKFIFKYFMPKGPNFNSLYPRSIFPVQINTCSNYTCVPVVSPLPLSRSRPHCLAVTLEPRDQLVVHARHLLRSRLRDPRYTRGRPLVGNLKINMSRYFGCSAGPIARPLTTQTRSQQTGTQASTRRGGHSGRPPPSPQVRASTPGAPWCRPRLLLSVCTNVCKNLCSNHVPKYNDLNVNWQRGPVSRTARGPTAGPHSCPPLRVPFPPTPRSAFGVWGTPTAGYAVLHPTQPP